MARPFIVLAFVFLSMVVGCGVQKEAITPFDEGVTPLDEGVSPFDEGVTPPDEGPGTPEVVQSVIQVEITAPEEGSTVESGAVSEFTGTVNDSEFEGTEVSVVWSSDIDGELCAGTVAVDGSTSCSTCPARNRQDERSPLGECAA